MPHAKFIEKRIDPPINNTDRDLNFKYNSVKLRHWVDFLDKTKENVIFAEVNSKQVKNLKIHIMHIKHI